jgi:hypothetical protein
MTEENKTIMDSHGRQEDECCKKSADSIVSDTVMEKKGGLYEKMVKNPVQTLVSGLLILVIVNIVVMITFTVTVNGKLDEAIALNKPMEAKLMLIIPSNCDECGDLSDYKKMILAQKVEVLEDVIFSADSERGNTLITEYGIERLPALIMTASQKIDKKNIDTLPQGARAVGDNALVWEDGYPPYLDVGSSEVQGLVSVIYLTNNSCVECYGVVDVQRPILQRFGVVFASEQSIDASSREGKSIIDEYGIQSLPTIVLSPEIDRYTALKNVWSQVGTIEEDGSYVFRELGALGVTYRDLKTGKIVEQVIDDK